MIDRMSSRAVEEWLGWLDAAATNPEISPFTLRVGAVMGALSRHDPPERLRSQAGLADYFGVKASKIARAIADLDQHHCPVLRMCDWWRERDG